MTTVQLYDTTLRDGMQGQGMSLSAAEKVRVVQALDRLGVHFVEAGFPSSNPKEEELFELLAGVELENAAVCAFGMTRRRGIAADEDEALRTLVASFAPVCTLVGKTWGLHLEKVTKVSREENLAMIIDSVNYCRAERQAGRLRRRALLRRLARRLRLRARVPARRRRGGCRERDALRHERRQPAARRSPRPPRRSSPSSARGSRSGSTPTTTPSAGSPTRSPPSMPGARMVQGTMNGHGERCGNANLVSILPALELKLGFEVVGRERLRLLTETSHFVDELLNLTPDPDQAYVGRNAFAHKGGMHVAGIQADARTFEHLDPELVGNGRDVLISELSGKGSVLSRAERAGIDLDADAAKRAVERVKEREHRGYHYEAADASFELLLRREAGQYASLFRLESFRVITEKRADGHVETEATIKIWVDGRRYVRTAEGNGPVNALDRALRRRSPTCIRTSRTSSSPTTRFASSTRTTAPARSPGCCSTRPTASDSWGSIGVSENIIEASWEALVDSLEYAFQPRRDPPRRNRRTRGRMNPDPIPLARPALGEREEELVLEVLRSGRLSLGPVQERFEREFAAWLGVDDAVAVSSGTAALHLGVRRLGWGEGDEVVTSPFSFVASANCLLYEDATPVFADVDPVTLNLDSGRARGRGGREDRRPAPGRHLRVSGGVARAVHARRRARARRARGRLRGVRRRRRGRGQASAPAATSPPSRSTPTSS